MLFKIIFLLYELHFNMSLFYKHVFILINTFFKSILFIIIIMKHLLTRGINRQLNKKCQG